MVVYIIMILGILTAFSLYMGSNVHPLSGCNVIDVLV